MTALAADAQIEAIDGPAAVGPLEGKSMPVLTRFPDGRIGFRMMGKFQKTGPVPVLKVTFENGKSVRVGPEQLFVKKDGATVTAADLRPDDAVAPSWDYRAGYRPPDLPDRRPADGTLLVKSVSPDGEAEVLGAPVRETGVFFLACGALLKA